MKRMHTLPAAAAALLLSACSTVNWHPGASHDALNKVAVVNYLPAPLAAVTYTIEPATDAAAPEARQAADLIRHELNQLGWKEAAPGGQAQVRVAAEVKNSVISSKVKYQVVSGGTGAIVPFTGGTGTDYQGNPQVFSGGTGCCASNSQLAPFVVQKRARLMTVAFRSAQDGRQLYEVAVYNQSEEAQTSKLMPALVASAFDSFPARHGEVRTVTQPY